MAFIPVLIRPMNEVDLVKNRLVAQLLSYCHLIEMDLLYNSSLNLAMISKGGRFQKEPFPTSYRRKVQRKIELISRENRDLGTIFSAFYCRHIRNAFAHSKYKIEAGYFVKTDEDFKISIDDFIDKTRLLNAYYGFFFFKIGQEQISAMKQDEIQNN